MNIEKDFSQQITELANQAGSEELDTTAQTLSGAVNELDAEIVGVVLGQIPDGSLTPKKTDFITEVNYANLFDSSAVTANFYINSSGVLEALSNYDVSDYIPAVSEQIFVMTQPTGLTYDGSFLAYYNSAKSKLGQKHMDSDEGIYWKVALPTNGDIAYVRLNMGNGALTSMMVVSGAVYPENYIPFGSFYLLDSDIASAYANPLYGKILAVDGDSIAQGATGQVPYAAAIAVANNMTLDTLAASGGTLKSGTGHHCIATSVASLRADADYFIIEGGVNDGGGSAGSLSSGYDAVLDTATLAGAIETVCKTLRVTFAGKKCGFVFPHRIFADDDAYNTVVRPLLISALEKWGVPYLDLQKLVPSLNLIAALKAAYTDSGDGWHPNTAGYAAFYNDQIEAWMKTL